MRYWNGRKKDDGSVHCLGNGRICVYEQGPDIIQLFGPPYSSPSLIKLLLGDENLKAESKRVFGTAVWEHLIINESTSIGEITDFVDTEVECFVRGIKANSTFKLQVEVGKETVITDNSKQFQKDGFSGGFIIYSQAGKHLYNDYPLPTKIFFQILLSGDIQFTINGDGSVEMKVAKGTSKIYIIGGVNYKECCLNVEKVIKSGYEKMLAQTEAGWNEFSERRHDFETMVSKAAPMRTELMEAIDSVANLIKTQQGGEGGVQAGYNYHMGYVRDQYGVFRCLLKLGYYEEAKKILSFYWNVWKGYGRICNAQCMGVPGIFHVHENDEVEITGYLLIQAFKYLEVTGEDNFLSEINPMLEWAFEAQKKHIVVGMLPFNGDETYVAGGVLPRTALNDGSAEATMMFVLGGEKLLSWFETNSIWDKKKLDENRRLLSEVRDQYRVNFFKAGKLLTNNPERKKYTTLPRFRHGVCEGCLQSSKEQKPYLFGWTEKNENDRYLCPDCKVNNNLERAPDTLYYLQSVSLMPLYIDSDLLTKEEIAGLLEPIIEAYNKTGKLPSRPDGNVTVGYDYGLMLYTLTELGHPLAEDIYCKMMSVIDSTGAWVEYYENGRPFNTRCRPWESGINLEAAIHYMQKKYSNKG